MKRKGVSLSSELHLVSRTIDGMRILSQRWKELHFTDDELPRLAHALHATLVLVRERLVLLDCAVRDSLDPRYLFHPENEAFDEQPGDDGDVVLKSWSAKKTAEKLRKDADQAEHRLHVLGDRRQRRKTES